MNHLTRADYAGALALLVQLERATRDPSSFARNAAAALGDYVASELITLGVCDLATGQRTGVAPLGVGLTVHRAAVPLYRDGGTLVSLVLERRGPDFTERDRERLELVRPHLAFLYRVVHGCATGATDGVPETRPIDVDFGALTPVGAVPDVLTAREREVMHWLSRGKTDADIAALLSMSKRTVHKHLEHIYVKLGVETRTAAVMRVLEMTGSPVKRARTQALGWPIAP